MDGAAPAPDPPRYHRGRVPDRDAVPRSLFLRGRAPEATAASLSLGLSAAVQAQQSLPNNDGVFYILSAEAFARGGIGAAATLHPWPFYPALVAGVSLAFGLSAEAAAHLTGALLLALVSALMVALAREMGGDGRVAWCAALVAVSHPWLNRARSLIVRDDGAWAFGLLALLLLLRSGRGRRLSALAGWALCGVLAALCRPETVVLMAAGPLTVALASDLEGRARRARALLMCVPGFLASVGAIVWLAREPARYRDLFSLEALANASNALAASFPLPYGREYAPFILVSGLLLIPIVKTLKAAGVVHLGLAAFSAASGVQADVFKKTALGSTLVASAVPLYVQLLRLLFVESRYTVLATLLLSILAPAGLALFFAPAASARRRFAGLLLAAALVGTAILNFPLKAKSEDQILAAADWIRTQAPGAKLHTNSLQLAYRSGARVDWNAVQHAQMSGRPGVVLASAGDLWSLHLPPGASLPSATPSNPGFDLVTSFPGPEGDVLGIYRCAAPECRGSRP